MAPLGLAFGLEVYGNDKGRAFIKIQFEIAAAKPLKEISFGMIAETFKLLQSEFADLIKIDHDTLVNADEQRELHPAVYFLKALVTLLRRGISFQLPAEFRLIIISKCFLDPQN